MLIKRRERLALRFRARRDRLREERLALGRELQRADGAGLPDRAGGRYGPVLPGDPSPRRPPSIASAVRWPGTPAATVCSSNAIAVGFTRTAAGVARLGGEIYDRAGALTPQRRASEPEDVAALALALWLGSSANASVTGEIVREGTSAARTPLVAVGG
jgi:hypothetical protein